MPYSSISTVNTGDVISAAHLNLLSANQEFLYGLARKANAGFTSYRKTGTTLNSSDMLWHAIPHLHQYLLYKLSLQDASNTVHQRIFYAGNKVVEVAGASGGIEGNVDLTDLSTLPNITGAWSGSSVSYDDDLNGDGEVVTHGGEYYKCIDSHTSGAGTEPGVGANWEDVWVLLATPTVGVIYDMYVTIAKSVSAEMTVDYLIESSATSI